MLKRLGALKPVIILWGYVVVNAACIDIQVMQVIVTYTLHAHSLGY